MKKLLVSTAAVAVIAAAFMLTPIRKVAASTYTILYSQWLQHSLIDSTAIGSTTPSTGVFTSLNTSTMQLGGTAPNGHTLVGNGTNYVDAAGAPVQATTTAGLISSDGTSGSRQFYQTANPDTTAPVAGYIYQNTSGAAMIVMVSADGGGSGFHGVVYCDATATPSTVLTKFGRVNSGSSGPNFYPAAVEFVVPNGYYYGISVTSGGGPPIGSSAMDTWAESVL